MNRLTLAIAVLTLANPASACHKYSVWNYPYPQRCGPVAQVADEKPPMPPEKPRDLPPFTVNDYGTIILRPDPKRTDEEGRAQAIEILREIMGK